MKIVHWAKYYPPEWGGMERVTVDLAKGMAQQKIATVVVAFTQSINLPAVQECDGVSVIRARQNARIMSQPISFRWAWQCVVQSLRADAVIVHAPNLLAVIPAIFIMLLRLFHRGPETRILLWHSDIVDKGVVGLVFRPIEHLLAIFATHIVATSPPYAAASKLLSQYQKKIHVIPIGIDPPQQHDELSVVSSKIRQLVAGRKIILSIGRLVGYKGYNDLITAANLLEGEFTLLIVGTGPDYDALNEQILQLGLTEKVFLVGACSQKDLEFLLESADIFVLASCKRSEAFGVVLLEAMSYGLPIVSCDIPGSGVPWVAQHNENALIGPVNDPTLLARNIDRLLSDDRLATQLGDRGLTIYNDRFKLSSAVDAYIKLVKA